MLADRLFHSGEHETYTVRTVEGYEVTGTANHPLLCLVDLGGVPTLLWKLIEEIRPGDPVLAMPTVSIVAANADDRSNRRPCLAYRRFMMQRHAIPTPPPSPAS